MKNINKLNRLGFFLKLFGNFPKGMKEWTLAIRAKLAARVSQRYKKVKYCIFFLKQSITIIYSLLEERVCLQRSKQKWYMYTKSPKQLSFSYSKIVLLILFPDHLLKVSDQPLGYQVSQAPENSSHATYSYFS